MSLTASETDNMQVKINSSDKQSKNGDEQIEGMSISDIPEFTDPAILAVREITKVRYTKEELINLRNVPLSKKKPDFLESTEGLPWIFGSERWPFDRKKSGSNEPSDNNSGNNSNGGSSDHRRRNSGDPRERIRKENDGIVLSPQRRSFNSGCFVPASRVETATRNTRPHSPLGPKNDGTHIGVREIQPSSRRIGSGRILRANGDFNDKPETTDSDNYGNGFRGPRGPNNNDEKYERRNFGRDFDMGRDRDRENNKESRRSGRAFERRKITEQEEPEWFSGGPISQHDTIELRGFDDADKPGRKKISPSQMKRAKEWSKKKEELQSTTQTKEDNDKVTTDRTTISETKVVVEVSDLRDEKDANQGQESETKNKKAETDQNCKVSSMLTDQSLNFDDILKCDTIPGLLSNIEIEYDGNTSKSRFSRWFKQESPEKQDSRRSSLHEDSIIKNLLNDIGETNVITSSIPGDSEAYFAPISPAGNNLGGVIGTGKRETSNSQMKRPINLIEMLQMNNHQPIQNAKQPLVGKILSLDELEAKIRKNTEPVGVPQKPPSKPDEEMSAAFKKLLSQAQATGGHNNGPVNKTQPMSLLEMLKDSQQQDEAARLSAAGLGMGPASPHHHNPQQSHFANEIALHLQQVQMKQQQKQQMEMFNKLINSTTSMNHHQIRTSPSLHDIGFQQQTRELLNRPEAQAILQGLKRGEITTQHLYQQLANPALQHRHREMLLTILKIQNTTATSPGYGLSPRVSPVPPHHHHIFQQQQQQSQQLRVSPLPPNAMQQRIPSPRELQVHTQNILQRALIKKKLEEQQENYRKKQEMAFTPTSVLRKMTAEKDESKENKISGDKLQTGRPLTGMRPQPPQPQGNTQWYGNPKQPGRPIVKANNYQTQTPEQFFSQHQQHQRIFNQFQQQQLSSQQLQQRKTSASNQFGGSSQPPTSSGGQQFNHSSQFHLTNQQFGQQLTQQQLRAQHQHRPNNSQNASAQQPTHHQQSQPQQSFPQQQQGGGVWQQILSNTQQPQRTNRNSNPTNRSENNDISQTTNQLAQWFSPDLLERARGGELPSTAGLAQHVISLEEIERQTAPPVHN